MTLTLREIEKATGGKLKGADCTVAGFTIDSREVPNEGLYIAIKGDRFDGHDFCAGAVKNGACAVVCERDPGVEVPYVLVKSCRQALLDIAGLYRSRFKNLRVVGLTGSVGKTTTKEMTWAVLTTKFKTLKTEGNLNNEIGMPKTLFRLKDDTEAAVIEMGMSAFGEISRMTKSARPDVGIITNIGMSHIEFLGSRDGILKAKTEILEGMPEGAPLVINGDDDKLCAYQNPKYRLVYFAIDNHDADVYADNIREENGETVFTAHFDGKTQEVMLPTVGKHNVYDALAAFCVGLLFEIVPEQIAVGLSTYTPSGMRQRIRKVHGVTVMEDCYNASPDSQKAALQVLASLPAKRKIAVLGDMLELGSFTNEAHKAVGAFAAKQKIDLLYCFGEAAKQIAAGAGDKVKSRCFNTHEALLQALLETLSDGDAVLFKASHSMHLEEVIEKLYEEWNVK